MDRARWSWGLPLVAVTLATGLIWSLMQGAYLSAGLAGCGIVLTLVAFMHLRRIGTNGNKPPVWAPSFQYLVLVLVQTLVGVAGCIAIGNDLVDSVQPFAVLAFLACFVLLAIGACSLALGLLLRFGVSNRATRFWFPASRQGDLEVELPDEGALAVHDAESKELQED